jgi:hypothetical protein
VVERDLFVENDILVLVLVLAGRRAVASTSVVASGWELQEFASESGINGTAFGSARDGKHIRMFNYPYEESLEKRGIGELEEAGEKSDIVVANGIHEQLQFF